MANQREMYLMMMRVTSEPTNVTMKPTTSEILTRDDDDDDDCLPMKPVAVAVVVVANVSEIFV